MKTLLATIIGTVGLLAAANAASDHLVAVATSLDATSIADEADIEGTS